MRKLVLGAALVGLAALTVQGASAQGLSVIADFGGYGYDAPRAMEEYRRPRVVEEHRVPRREWRDRAWGHGDEYRPHRRFDAYGYGRPVGLYPEHRGADCVVRVNRYFDGYAYVKEKRRICR